MSRDRVRLSDQVASKLQNMIFSKYSPGDKLPVEMELAQLFSVSRVTIREAIGKLSTMGIVDVRQGEGTFINKLSVSSFMQPMLPMLTLSNASLTEIFEVRLLIETYAAEQAALHVTKENIHLLQVPFECMEQAALTGELSQYTMNDVLFHKAIAQCSGNSVIAIICDLITEMIRESIFESCKTPAHIMNSVIYHYRIYQAISNHNAEESRKMMQEHLVGGLSFLENVDIPLQGKDVSTTIAEK